MSQQKNPSQKQSPHVPKQSSNSLSSNQVIKDASYFEIESDDEPEISNIIPTLSEPTPLTDNNIIYENPFPPTFAFSCFNTVHSKLNSLSSQINSLISLTNPSITISTNTLPLPSTLSSLPTLLSTHQSTHQSTISQSINYFNNELHQREKKYNQQHQQTTRNIIQNNMKLEEIKNEAKKMDYKGMQEKVKELMRKENRCEEVLVGLEECVDRAVLNWERKRKQREEEKRKRREEREKKGEDIMIDGVEYQMVQVDQEELTSMILQEYDLEVKEREEEKYPNTHNWNNGDQRRIRGREWRN